MLKVTNMYLPTNTLLHYPSFLHAARNLTQDARNLAQDARNTISVA